MAAEADTGGGPDDGTRGIPDHESALPGPPSLRTRLQSSPRTQQDARARTALSAARLVP